MKEEVGEKDIEKLPNWEKKEKLFVSKLEDPSRNSCSKWRDWLYKCRRETSPIVMKCKSEGRMDKRIRERVFWAKAQGKGIYLWQEGDVMDVV
jgi:hypothetical protein